MDQMHRNISGYIDVFLRRKWAFISLAVAGAVIGGVIAYTLPAYYMSSTLIVIEEQQVPTAYVTPTDVTPVAQRINVIKQHILSRTKLEEIIKNFNLYAGSRPGSFLSRLLPWQSDALAKDEAIDRMREDIEFKVVGAESHPAWNQPNRRDAAFTISYTGRDPNVAMQVTNMLASLLIEENLKIREQYAEGTSEFLVTELEKAKKELSEQEAAIRRFKESRMGSLPEQIDANLRTLDRLQLELQSVSGALKNAEDRKALLDEQLGGGLVSRGRGEADALVERLEALKGELNVLRASYKDDYPDVALAVKRIAELEAQLAQRKAEGAKRGGLGPEVLNSETYANLKTIESQIETLGRREADIRRQIKDFERRVDSTPSNEQRLADLRRDYDISLSNYQSLLEKKMNARLAENLEKKQKGERFRIIDSANLPEKPFKPNRLSVALSGLLAGLGAGAGLVFLIELMNPAFRKTEELEQTFRFAVLAAIPDFSVKPARPGAYGKIRLLKGRKAGQG